MEQKNAQNAAQRNDWTMTARNEAYTAIVASCQKNAKVLGDEMVATCITVRRWRVAGAWFDGP